MCNYVTGTKNELNAYSDGGEKLYPMLKNYPI